MTASLTVQGWPAIEVAPGSSLLDACDAARVPMNSACGGFAACNSCRVEVVSGGEGLTERLAEEDAFLDAPGQRLGCQARLRDGARVVVRLAPGA
jgi:ferredoxin